MLGGSEGKHSTLLLLFLHRLLRFQDLELMLVVSISTTSGLQRESWESGREREPAERNSRGL